MPTIKELLSAFSKNEFWYGLFLAGGSASFLFAGYMGIKIDNINLKHALEINRIENKESLLAQEKMLLAEKKRKLESEIKILMQNNDKLLTREKVLMEGMSGYCYELKVAVRTLQKEHKLQYKFDINYEYRSILEKVLIDIYSEAERCSQVLSPRS